MLNLFSFRSFNVQGPFPFTSLPVPESFWYFENFVSGYYVRSLKVCNTIARVTLCQSDKLSHLNSFTRVDGETVVTFSNRRKKFYFLGDTSRKLQTIIQISDPRGST